MSLVNWEQYSNQELRYKRSKLRQDERDARQEASKWSLPAETSRHASERAANCAEMIEEINAVLDRRHEEAARRREKAETRHQEGTMRQQARAADGDEAERARQAALGEDVAKIVTEQTASRLAVMFEEWATGTFRPANAAGARSRHRCPPARCASATTVDRFPRAGEAGGGLASP